MELKVGISKLRNKITRSWHFNLKYFLVLSVKNDIVLLLCFAFSWLFEVKHHLGQISLMYATYCQECQEKHCVCVCVCERERERENDNAKYSQWMNLDKGLMDFLLFVKHFGKFKIISEKSFEVKTLKATYFYQDIAYLES